MGREKVQEVTEYDYQVHVVTDAEYKQISISSSFRGGVVVEGCAGLGNDCLIITAHVTLRSWRTDVGKMSQLEDHRGKDVER